MSRRTTVGLVVIGLALSPWMLPLGARPTADALYDGHADAILALAAAVERDMARGARSSRFSTGSERFDEEWAFGMSMMAAMGFGQAAILVPEARPRMLRGMERALDAMLSSEGRAYDRNVWREDPLDALAHDRGHASYFGYGGLALGLHRLLVPEGRHAALHDRFVAAIARRLDAAPHGLVETYPEERYAPDIAMSYGALCLAARSGHGDARDPSALLRVVIDPATGLARQALGARGQEVDGPRGSGTAFMIYALSFCDTDHAAALDRTLERSLSTSVGAFGAMREYPRGRSGKGDIDSGPVLFGASVSATGFSLAGARAFRRRARFRDTYATTWLFGAPLGAEGFVTGGPLGNAILFAMLTALPPASIPGVAP